MAIVQTRRQIAYDLYAAAFKFFRLPAGKHESITFKEVHLTPELRCDILHLEYYDKVRIVELKSCREDFTSDNKWQKYLDYCDYFYFMCPPDVIKREELPKNVGLIYASVSEKGIFVDMVKAPYKLRPKFLNSSWFQKTYKKLAFRKFVKIAGYPVSLDEEILFKID